MTISEQIDSDKIQKTRVTISITKDAMEATAIIKKPLPDDPPVTENEIYEAIKENNIVFGIDEEAIRKIVEENEFNTPVIIASGEKAEKGDDTKFEYHFDTSQDHKPEVDQKGHIDYKNINFIQNVEQGALLVTKIKPTPGREGTNIHGVKFKGQDGKDIPMKSGDNTEISENGMELRASINGAVVFLNGKVSVNDVVVVRGDVDYNTGNIESFGSVKINGNIKTGFSVKTNGDLEVSGNVEDCDIDVKGNIMIKGGFFGKGTGLMKAGGEVYIKFVEGQRIEAKGNIVVGGEVINSNILSGGDVVINGQKGKIVGGEVKAHREIRAFFLGSESGTKTLLSVAYDSELARQYNEITKEKKRLDDDSKRVKEVLVGLYRLQMDHKLSGDQQAALDKLEKFNKELPANLENLQNKIKKIEEELLNLDGAQIVAEGAIYSGVRVAFGLVHRDVLDEAENCVLKVEGNKITFSDLKESK